MKLIIRNTLPEEWILATRAAKKLFRSEYKDIIVSYENGKSFWCKYTSTGNISVSGEDIKNAKPIHNRQFEK